jgi:hypothetical protein
MGIAKQFSPGQIGAMTQRNAGRSVKKRQNWSSQAQAKSRMIERIGSYPVGSITIIKYGVGALSGTEQPAR